MDPIDFDDDTWTIEALKAKLEDHDLYRLHGMKMPAKILEKDLKSAAQLFDQPDPSTTIADGKAPQPIAYHYAHYAINPDLWPMAEAAGIINTYGKEFSNGGLARRLRQWDAAHVPLIAIFLPRQKKGNTPVLPKRAVQTQSKTGADHQDQRNVRL